MYIHFGVSTDICGVRGLFIRFSISRTFVYVKIFIGLKIDLSKLNAFILIAMEKIAFQNCFHLCFMYKLYYTRTHARTRVHVRTHTKYMFFH